MTSNVLTNTITVRVEDEDFEFRIPSPMDVAKIGSVAAGIRRKFDPEGIGYEDGLDINTIILVRAMATMEVLLEKSTAKWAFSETKDARGQVSVAVDSSKFPPTATGMLYEIYNKFQEEVTRFLGRGAGNAEPASAEPVASQPNP